MVHALNVWLSSTGKVIDHNDATRKATHLMLDGGRLDITEDHSAFQEMYSKHIKLKNCIVEMRTDFFKFFIDFDVLSEDIIDMSEYILVIQNTMSNLYKNNSLVCIVTGADKNKEITKNEKLYLKQGFHMHWPDVVSDTDTARSIRKRIITNLTTVFGKNEKHFDSWEKIVDRCVYDKNGLRLVGSDKCNRSDGKLDYEDRVYIFKDVYTGTKRNEELFDIYSIDTLRLVKDTSIRSDEMCITKLQDELEYVEEETKPETKGDMVQLSRQSPEYQVIEKFFKLHAKGYRVEDIRGISYVKDKCTYIISSKSKYCQNKQGFHTNNHIYFKLTPKGLCQKCMSENHGIHGCCREYQSVCVPITTSLESALKWKKPKIKEVKKKPQDFTLPGFLEKLENKITDKDAFMGPGKKR